MESVIEAIRPSVRRNVALGVVGLLLASLYVAWVLASPNSLLSQMLRGRPAAEAARAAPTAGFVSGPLASAAADAVSVDPSQPPALLFRQMSPEAAGQVNAAMPFWTGPNPAAAPFKLTVTDPAERAQAVQCLTEAVYYEAGQEPLSGAQGVAQVVLNRLRHPIFPKTVCGVVFQGSEQTTGCQFSFTCDGARNRVADPVAWKRAKDVAEKALNGFVASAVGQSTHYHAQYVVPYWMPTMNKLVMIGQHIFYRWPGPDGRLVAPYGGSELVAMLLVPPGAMTPKVVAAPPMQVAASRAADLAIVAAPEVKLEARGLQASNAASGVKLAESGETQTVELSKPELVRAAVPDLGKLNTRVMPPALPAAVLMLAPPCAGPTCGAWR